MRLDLSSGAAPEEKAAWNEIRGVEACYRHGYDIIEYSGRANVDEVQQSRDDCHHDDCHYRNPRGGVNLQLANC